MSFGKGPTHSVNVKMSSGCRLIVATRRAEGVIIIVAKDLVLLKRCSRPSAESAASREASEAGRLVRVLEDWTPTRAPLTAAFKALIDFARRQSGAITLSSAA